MIAASFLPAPDARSVHVWRLSLALAPQELATCEAVLSPDERLRAARLLAPPHCRRFVAARGQLRMLLARYLQKTPADLRFAHGPTGKPLIESCGIHFNLSRSGDIALVAVSRESVGIDLEEVREVEYEQIARQLLAEAAVREIAQAAPADKAGLFCRHWVRLEARLKALGLRLGESCPDIPVYDLDAGPRHCAALATAIENPQIQWQDSR
jgi:4'-phosphopantetheinyl transferase